MKRVGPKIVEALVDRDARLGQEVSSTKTSTARPRDIPKRADAPISRKAMLQDSAVTRAGQESKPLQAPQP
jgi:hypothetical protein